MDLWKQAPGTTQPCRNPVEYRSVGRGSHATRLFYLSFGTAMDRQNSPFRFTVFLMTERGRIMGWLKEINKVARAATAQQRKLETQLRKNARAAETQQRNNERIQKIAGNAERMINVANTLLNIAAKPGKVSARIAKLKQAKSKISQIKQLVNRYSFLSVSNLHVFEADIVRIESEIRRDQQLATEQKKQRPKQAKTQRVKTDKPPKATVQRKAKDSQPKSAIFKYDSSFECLRLPRTKR